MIKNKKIQAGNTIKIALLSGSAIIGVLLLELILALFSFPTEVPFKFSHPPNYTEIRKSLEFQYRFETNSKGLRYREIPDNKPSNTHRVFAIGDSFTEGFGVSDNQRFTNLLENRYSKDSNQVAFINGGLAGTGVESYGKLVYAYALELEIDAILICIFVNDLANSSDIVEDLLPSKKRHGLKGVLHSLLPRLYTLLNQLQIQIKHNESNKFENFIESVTDRARKNGISDVRIEEWKKALPSNIFEAIREGLLNPSVFTIGLLDPEYWVDSIDVTSEVARRKWSNLSKHVVSLKEFSKKNQIQLSIVLIPSLFQYDQRSHAKDNPYILSGCRIKKEWLTEETGIQKKLRSLSENEGIEFLDLTPLMRDAVGTGKKLNWELDGHWNPTGHRVAANSIANWLENEKVFSFITAN